MQTERELTLAENIYTIILNKNMVGKNLLAFDNTDTKCESLLNYGFSKTISFGKNTAKK